MSDDGKVTVRLTNGEEITEMDCTEGVCVLVARGDYVHDFGVIDAVTKGFLLASALIELPENLYNSVIEFANKERCNRKPVISTGNVIPLRRSEYK